MRRSPRRKDKELLRQAESLADRLRALGYRDFQIEGILADAGLDAALEDLADHDLETAVRVLEDQIGFAHQCLRATSEKKAGKDDGPMV